jgi:hypothetical protein
MSSRRPLPSPLPSHDPRSRSPHDGRIRRSRLGRGGRRAAVALAALLIAPVAAAPVADASLAPFAITDASVADQAGVAAVAAQLAGVLLGAGVQVVGTPTVNGGDPFNDPSTGITAFGTFSGGTNFVGIPSGLVIGANARASSFATNSIEEGLSGDRDDNQLAALLNAAGLPGNCSGAGFNASNCINNATSLEFSVIPTDRYLKFEYVLAITEYGSYFEGAWDPGSAIFIYPDGFGLFVNGTGTADNCAVIPRTTTYVSMQTAGVVAPTGQRSNNRAAAQANLDALIASPTPPGPGPGLAYQVQTGGWEVQFLTVPLTCVVDLGATLPASVPIKIVIADANDSYVPPAVFLAGGSVRFSSTDTPSADDAGGGGSPPTPPAASGPAPSPIPDPGGDLPTSTPPGSSSGSVGGVPTTPTPSVPTSGTASYRVGDVQAEIQVGGAGTVTGPTTAPIIQVVRDRVGTVGGGGMAPGGIVEVWMPLPGGGSRQVALLPVGPDGTFSGALPFTGELDGGGPLPIGQRTIQLFGTDANGQLTVINVGIRVTQPGPLAPEPERGPNAPPALSPGQSLATNAGLPTPVTVTPRPGTRSVGIAGDGWLLDIAVPEGTLRDEAGNPIMEIVLGDRTVVSGTGFLPGTRAYVWLMSTPRFLGEVTIRPDGTFTGALPVRGVTVGPHTLQVSGVGTDGYIRAANLGVIVTGDARRPTGVRAGEGTAPLLPMQLAGLLVAGLAGVAAATRTRRRTTT